MRNNTELDLIWAEIQFSGENGTLGYSALSAAYMPGDSPGQAVATCTSLPHNKKTTPQQQHHVQASGSLISHEFKKVTKLHAKR